MKVFLSAALATAVFASSAIAEDAGSTLVPGKPAGVQQAQTQAVNPIVYLGMAGVVGAIVVAVSHGHSNHGGSTATTTTGTSP